jgi:cytochrome c
MTLTGNGRWIAPAVLMIGAGGACAADLELGRYLAAECMTCHRAATRTSTIPDIFGRPEGELTAAIVAYREKRLPNPVMQNVAVRLTDEEVAALASYFATAAKP